MSYRIYDYLCKACGRSEEYMLKEEEKDSMTCPICATTMTRLLNTSGYYRIAGDNSGSSPSSKAMTED